MIPQRWSRRNSRRRYYGPTGTLFLDPRSIRRTKLPEETGAARGVANSRSVYRFQFVRRDGVGLLCESRSVCYRSDAKGVESLKNFATVPVGDHGGTTSKRPARLRSTRRARPPSVNLVHTDRVPSRSRVRRVHTPVRSGWLADRR